MFRLLQFIKKYHFFLIFLLLEVWAVSFIIVNNSYNHSVTFTAFAEFSGMVHQKQESVRRYFHLNEVNDSLMTENARLRMELSKYVGDFNFISKPDSNHHFRFYYIPARVINNSVDSRKNFITLNIGSKQGVRPHMGVISSNGIVGIIKSVSPNYSVAISVLNEDFKLNAKIKESGEVGSIVWDGEYYRRVVLSDIPNRVSVKEGYHVVVGPYSNIFPENYPIGKIQKVKLSKGETFYDIYVSLNTDLKNNTSVFVISKYNIQEQDSLENNSKK